MSSDSLTGNKQGFSAFKRREALPEAIANSVAEAISLRQLTAGERIFESALAEKLGVSRVPVREALQILHTQGIIEGGGHRGYHVASFSEEMIHSVHEARIELETLFLRDAVKAWRSGRSDFAVLDEVIDAMRRAEKNGDVREMLAADVAFHTAICNAAKNPLFSKLWTVIARHILIILNLSREQNAELHVTVGKHEALRERFQDMVANTGIADPHAVLQAHFSFPAERKR